MKLKDIEIPANIDLADILDGGWIHGFGVGYYLVWRDWHSDDEEEVGWSPYDADFEKIPLERRMMNPPPITKPIPEEGILVYCSITFGWTEENGGVFRYFPDFSKNRPANDEDWEILKNRVAVLVQEEKQ